MFPFSLTTPFFLAGSIFLASCITVWFRCYVNVDNTTIIIVASKETLVIQYAGPCA
jgi:hypothetical protein